MTDVECDLDRDENETKTPNKLAYAKDTTHWTWFPWISKTPVRHPQLRQAC